MLSSIASADVVIQGTRIIYPASERQVSVKLTNGGEHPALVQVWADRSEHESPFTPKDLENAPFLITPPIFRIDGAQSQTLRLRFAGEEVPQDRESVFWLNMLEVPPEPPAAANGEESNYVQFAIRVRIKIFYRPEGLAGSMGSTVEGLRWTLVPNGEQGKPVLRVSNPGTYHTSFNRVELVSDGKSYPYELGGMVAPGGHTDFPISGSPPSRVTSGQVKFKWLSDYGAAIDAEAPLSVAGSDARPASP
ncbi:chaperone protein EcpD [Cupriavidus sp. YR651]|uniref:fimbrial biogenesis chaperone n=1 Tax=Cupriavidus sp. YR651 TaxID=1855315 RepID=UPI00088939D9|nr:fimbria/pilus periplasmic chaperone [Cupriavidus sp. YR651]SDC00602.1 chaperone protein EcpD [Cupriavidus sp. YR651]